MVVRATLIRSDAIRKVAHSHAPSSSTLNHAAPVPAAGVYAQTKCLPARSNRGPCFMLFTVESPSVSPAGHQLLPTESADLVPNPRAAGCQSRPSKLVSLVP